MGYDDDLERPDPFKELGGDRAEKLVPGRIHRLALYFHSLTEIWEYYRALGNNPPLPFRAEMARAEQELLTALEEESGQGGALHEYYKRIGGRQ